MQHVFRRAICFNSCDKSGGDLDHYAIINTIFPDLLASFGGMTTALFKTGTLAFAAIILFFTGAGIKVNTSARLSSAAAC